MCLDILVPFSILTDIVDQGLSDIPSSSAVESGLTCHMEY